MTVKAVVFDIGGVLEFTPHLGLMAKWEKILDLDPGEMNERLGQVWHDGSIGAISEEDVHRSIRDIMGMSVKQVNDLMGDIWTEYLGTLNVELADYFRGLRPQYQTAILSNSFVGAREKEEAAYRFSEMTDFIIYSHEVGMSKPDPRIFALTCERLGLKPSEVLFVDDHQGHIDAARDCGVHGIVFQNNQQVIADIEVYLQDSTP